MHIKGDDLEKGVTKFLSSAALAGTIAMAQGSMERAKPLEPKSPTPVFSATELKPEKAFDRTALQQAMAQVESNNGKNTNHDLLEIGPDAGTHAKGHYGFTNSTIKDVIRNSPSFRNSHSHVLDFDDNQIHELIYNEEPALQHRLASEQINNITRELKTNKPEHVAYAWLHGITGAQKAISENKNINDHWHVKKVMQAYNNIINKQQMKKNNQEVLKLLVKKEKTPEETKTLVERSREISLDIQKLVSDQWKRARIQLNEDDIDEATKPNPLKNWNVDLEEFNNNDANLFIIDLIKSKML